MNKIITFNIIAFWILILFLLSVVASWLIWSVQSQTAKMQAELVQVEELLSRGASIEQFKKIAVQSKPKREKIESYLITKDAQIDFIERVETIAKGQNVDIKIDSVSNKEEPTLQTLTLNVRTQGNWQAIMRTLDLIEHMPHKIDIQALDLQTQKGTVNGKEIVLWQATFIINVAMTK